MIRAMGVPFVFGLVLLSVSIIKTQSFVILDQTEFDVWDDKEDNPNAEAEKLLAVLCENYLLSINSQQIDCASIRFGIKGIETDDSYHIISKRDAEDAVNLNEGSGNGDQPEIAIKEAPAIPASDDVAVENSNSTAVDKPKETEPEVQPISQNAEEQAPKNGTATVNVEAAVVNAELPLAPKSTEKQPPENAPVNQNEQTETKEGESAHEDVDTGSANEQQPAPEQENKDKENAAENSEPVPANADVPSESEVGENENKETKALLPDPQLQSTASSSTKSDKSRSETTIAPPVESSNKNEDNLRLATQKVLPSDLAEVETTSKTKESEAVNDQQSANAVVLKSPSAAIPVSVEGSDGDKQLAGVATNAKISNQASEAEQPKTGESSKNVSKAGKDTTILVVLFVVVIVIGAAAFTHNFMKKRRQKKNSENSEVVDGIRKSLQNLSGNAKNSNDIEQGTEMKPLMKSNSPVIVKEYTDTKKNADA